MAQHMSGHFSVRSRTNKDVQNKHKIMLMPLLGESGGGCLCANEPSYGLEGRGGGIKQNRIKTTS